MAVIRAVPGIAFSKPPPGLDFTSGAVLTSAYVLFLSTVYHFSVSLPSLAVCTAVFTISFQISRSSRSPKWRGGNGHKESQSGMTHDPCVLKASHGVSHSSQQLWEIFFGGGKRYFFWGGEGGGLNLGNELFRRHIWFRLWGYYLSAYLCLNTETLKVIVWQSFT